MIEDWQSHFDTSVYQFKPINTPVAKGRINPLLHRLSLNRFINQNDVVFFEWVGENLAVASRTKHTVPIIARLHSWELFHFARWVNWNNVDRIVLVSQAMQHKFNEMYPGHAAKTVVLPAGKSTTRFTSVPHAFEGKIAMLGNIIPIKRVYEMVLALAELRQRGFNFTLHIAGKPEGDFTNQRYYASLLGLIEKLGLRERVIFHGWVDSAKLLPQMDIFISNSYWEGQQNALIEAMACGCYCLSHFWDGAEEILPTEYLYSTDEMLVDKIISYACLSEIDKNHHLKQLSSIVERKFNVTDMIDQYRKLLIEEGKQ